MSPGGLKAGLPPLYRSVAKIRVVTSGWSTAQPMPMAVCLYLVLICFQVRKYSSSHIPRGPLQA